VHPDHTDARVTHAEGQEMKLRVLTAAAVVEDCGGHNASFLPGVVDQLAATAPR
jgi:hypothetical protein